MQIRYAAAVCAVVLGTFLVACSPPKPVQPVEPAVAESDAPEARGAAGGAGEESLNPNQLTGVPGIDQPEQLAVRILDARGTGRLGSDPIVAGKVTPVPPGVWMLTEADSEYEIALRSGLLPDGIVRLAGQAAFLIEPPLEGALPRFRLFGGQGSFYLPRLPDNVTVLTPVGPLRTRGAVFSVTVAPDSQVLITCREGAVYLTGVQNAVAQPGQVVVGDRLGRGRVYNMTPNEALVFAARWMKVMTEEATPIVAATLPRRLAAWKALNSRWTLDEARFTALWFRQARSVLGPAVPGPEVWASTLAIPVEPSRWAPLPTTPGLLGELP